MGDSNIEFGTEGIPASIREAAKKVGQERRRLYSMVKGISHRIGIRINKRRFSCEHWVRWWIRQLTHKQRDERSAVWQCWKNQAFWH